jgi:cell wall-associated NlpC family hydrolase
MEAWLRGGVRLPRSADDMVKVLPSVPLRDARPGDLLWWPGHVALYAGDGWTVEALDRRSGVVMRRAPKPKRVLRVAG